MKALLVLPLLAGCAGSGLSDITAAPIPCVVQARLGTDVTGNPRQLNDERDPGVCIRARFERN